MNTQPIRVAFLSVLLMLAVAGTAAADPCGMVPPIYTGPGSPIVRVGHQQTYVFYKDGVETFVIRPGFSGKVDEFGMLIPFPTPPAIRKVPDEIFGHIAAAIDPPEVVVDLRPQAFGRGGRGALLANSFQTKTRSLGVRRKNQVTVLRQEAVGMYEVAVLEAGSAAALKRWIDNHGYKYPDGMDKVCEEYIEDRWCFVAVKTKVGQKSGVTPKPGQREVDPKLPKDSTFDGSVQAMGFRFHSEELVVPMRLSSFNDGELRNVVYLLTEGPRKIQAIPEEYVVRQISGQRLFDNVTGLLPLRIIGGTATDIPEYRRKTLPQERDPAKHNAAAKELFASDLLAVTRKGLSLPHEEKEKELLRIGERFGLRGAAIDKINAQALADERRKTTDVGLAALKKMTLTVIDGDFPREVLARKNLAFAEYKMPSRRNRGEAYDAKLKGPGGKKDGTLKLGQIDYSVDPSELESRTSSSIAAAPVWWITGGLGCLLLGLACLRRRKSRTAAAITAVLVVSLANSAMADPCGMVPPIYTGPGTPIVRVGEQQTYVFYKDGVETFVIRPGFSGKVDEFGMLIPFPTPPAIRKVPDHIFDHIAAAIDPPEVVVNLLPQVALGALLQKQQAVRTVTSTSGLAWKQQVRVLRREAVGMYEVVVLEAGSSAALKRWMDDHGYKYPTGMDTSCDTYVEAGWCFVAVKTRVGQKGGVDPKPGQREVNSKLPKGSTFDGAVQAMGFRFRSEKLVVPMRLASFNAGELRNIVYLLSDGPKKIRSIPEEYVVRQISGEQLYRNVTGLLPLRIIGGTAAEIPEYRKKTLATERDPTSKNGAARDLFASDLLAATRENLSLPHEEKEKELLRIGERFGLRGGQIDALNTAALKQARDKTVAASLDALKEMTLSVIDGDFPREVLADQNLTFAEYKMPARRNASKSYDAKRKGPAEPQQGVLKVGAIDWEQIEVASRTETAPSRFRWAPMAVLAVLLSLAAWRWRR